MTIKQELEKLLHSEISEMHRLMQEGVELDIVALSQTQQKLYDLIHTGVFSSLYMPEAEDTDAKFNQPVPRKPRVKVVSMSKPESTKIDVTKQMELDDPDIVAQGFFKQSIKGGYVKDVFVPEKLTRVYNLHHDDWAVIRGNHTTFTDIEVIAPPILEYDEENHPSTSKLRVFPYAKVEEDSTGTRYIEKNLQGETLESYTGIKRMVLSDVYNSQRLEKGQVVDLRFDHTQEVPDPRVVWVHDVSELEEKGLTPTSRPSYQIKMRSATRGLKDWQANLE